MKRIIFFFSLALSLNVSLEANLLKAVTQARNQNKEILYFILSDDCYYCKKYFVSISQDKSLIDKIVNNYIIVIVNLSKGQKVDKYMPYNGITPTTIRIDKDGRPLFFVEGALSPQELELFIKGE